MSDYPCVLLQGGDAKDEWRIVRREFKNLETGEVKPEEVIEVADGKDAMNERRWKTLTRRDAGLSDWIRVAEGLTKALVAAKEL